jgi:hypothetical protein
MIADAQQFLRQQRVPPIRGQASLPFPGRDVIYVGGTAAPRRIEGQLRDRSRPTQPQTFGFLLAMAAISVAREIGAWLVGDKLLTWFGVALDPMAQSLLLQVLVGIAVAATFWRGTADPAARRHLLLTLLAALAIGLVLVWLSHLSGCVNALSWPLVPVYLLWAWTEAVSGPSVLLRSA